MGDPVSLMLTVASTAVSAIGKMAQGQAAAASYQSQAQAERYNAQANQMNANQTANEFAAKENALRAQQAQSLGRQRAALAESGIGVDSGTPQDLIEQDTRAARLDDLTLRYDGQTRRIAALNGATLNSYDAQVARMNAGQAQQSGMIGALGDVIGGAGRYMSIAASAPASNGAGWDPLGLSIRNSGSW
jgi:hypothetical protein